MFLLKGRRKAREGQKSEADTRPLLTELHKAVIKGDIDEVRALVDDADVDINSRDASRKTALHYAARSGSESIIEALQQRGHLELDARDLEGRTALHVAVERGHAELVEMLSCGHVVSRTDARGRTPLHWAAKNGLKDVLEALLERMETADVNIADAAGQTALHKAAQSGFDDVVSLLIEKGADDSKLDKTIETALGLAGEKGDMQATIRRLGQESLKPTYRSKVEQLVQRQPTMVEPVIFWAAENGLVHILEPLLEQGVRHDCRNFVGQTPLHVASKRGHVAVASFLVDWRADIESKDIANMTPLSLAVNGGNTAVIRFLVEKGADVDNGELGNTPTCIAAEAGDEAIVQLLLNRLLSESHPDPETRASMLTWPLVTAVRARQVAVVQLLLQHGANPNTRLYGRAALHKACKNDRNEAVAISRLLLEHGADVESRDDYERTPLFHAAEVGGKAMTRLLLENGAQIESRDLGHRTPIFEAVEREHEEVTEMLLAKGADIDSPDRWGGTPRQLAAKSRSQYIKQLFQDAENAARNK